MTKIKQTFRNTLLAICILMLGAYTAAADVLPNEVADTVSVTEVVVTGVRYEADASHLPLTVTNISRATLERHHRSSVLPTLTEHVPGLFATSRGVLGYGVSGGAAGQFTVRGIGGNPNTGVLVLIDGVPQYAGLYGHPIPDAYQTMLAERVEVVSGPASLLYGSNAMGGVINIVTRRMSRDGIQGSARLSGGSFGTLEADAAASLRKGAWSGRAGGSYARTDGHRPHAMFQQHTAFAKVGCDFSPHWGASADANLTHFDSSNPGEVGNPYIDNLQHITRGMASASLTNRYDGVSGALRAYYSWGHHQVNDGYHPGGTPQTHLYLHDDLMLGLSAYETASLYTGNKITLGADWVCYGGRAWNEPIVSGPSTLIADRTEQSMAAYVDFHQELTMILSANIGARVDHHSRTGTVLVPQGGLTLRLPRGIELRAMAGKGYRNPTIREMYMYPPQNPNLRPEQLVNYELSYRQTLMGGALQLGANLYHLDGKDLIATVRTDGRPQNVNIRQVSNNGVELTASYNPISSWSIHANYSFLDMKYPVVAAPEHKAYVGGSYRYSALALHTGIQYIGGLYTSVGDVATTESFVLWNLTADWELLPYLTLYVKGDNLLGQSYEVNYGFPMPGAVVMAGVNVRF